MPKRLTSIAELQWPKNQQQYNAGRWQDQSFYRSPEWRSLRAKIIAAYPVCQKCNRAASEEVHHVQPRRQRPDLALEPTNLRAWCKPCHSAETGRAQQQGKPVPRRFGQQA